MRGGFRDNSEEVEERASGRRMDAGTGESGMMKRDGGHVKDEGVGMDDSNERSCPVHVRDHKFLPRRRVFLDTGVGFSFAIHSSCIQYPPLPCDCTSCFDRF